MDPISSQGVQAALLSGVQGAAVVHTLLSQPTQAAAARQFAHDRQREAVRHHQAVIAGLYRDQWEVEPGAFWAERGGDARQMVSNTEPLAVAMPDLSGLVVVAPGTRLMDTPVLCDQFIEFRLAVLPPKAVRPVAFVGKWLIAALLDDLTTPTSVDLVLEKWTNTMAWTEACNCLEWLIEHGLVVKFHPNRS